MNRGRWGNGDAIKNFDFGDVLSVVSAICFAIVGQVLIIVVLVSVILIIWDQSMPLRAPMSAFLILNDSVETTRQKSSLVDCGVALSIIVWFV